jgi:catechol 2,3-dioxygenase-like lactoylglutathione lyase family enzyme
MLADAKIASFVATADPKAAREFYENVLGLEFISDEPYALVFSANGTTLRIQKVQ